VSPVSYEMDFYIPEEEILSSRGENSKSYIIKTLAAEIRTLTFPL
jgi:hypothetical protein